MTKNNKITENKKLHIKKGDRVVVISGKDKGKQGTVRAIDTKEGTVVIDGVNVVVKAQKANPMAGIQGGLNRVPRPINSSKVMVVCATCEKATRVKKVVKDGKKVRVCAKCGETLDV